MSQILIFLEKIHYHLMIFLILLLSAFQIKQLEIFFLILHSYNSKMAVICLECLPYTLIINNETSFIKKLLIDFYFSTSSKIFFIKKVSHFILLSKH